MSTLTSNPPSLSFDEVHEVARDLYGLAGSISALDSERDQNFKLVEASGAIWVVKIANQLESLAALDFQQSLLRHLAAADPCLPVPRIRAALDGAALCQTHGPAGEKHFVRIVGYLPGRPLALATKTPELLSEFGATLGRLDAALQSFGHAGAFVDLDWDLRKTARTRARLAHISADGDRKMVETLLDRFDTDIGPRLLRLRSGVIHNDANDYNILVDESGSTVTGIVDFGDALHSALIGELAIACAYAILDHDAPLEAAGRIASAYHRELPLIEAEIDLLFDLIMMRLIISLAMSASRRERTKGNAYLAISEAPAWALLRRLSAIAPKIATAVLRNACGLEGARGAGRVIGWIQANRGTLLPICHPHPRTVTKGLVPLAKDDDPIAIASRDLKPDTAQALWLQRAAEHGVALGVGPWGEERRIYSTPAFDSAIVKGQRRTLHLGLDLFLAAGSAVCAPLDATVKAIYLTDGPLDYGCAVLLEHEPENGLRFWSLWGHLARESVRHLSVGQTLAAGLAFARIGDTKDNGEWLPHLHLQLVTFEASSIDDVIGVGESDYRAVWADLFPDPLLFAGLPPETLQRSGRSVGELLAARKHCLLRNLSISYRQPLKIVRGEGVWMIDDRGRAYLDCYNNVAHLGHAHPEIVEVQARQAAILNTNTRYLGDAVIDYAERLTALLPPPLRVCGFVCTGSEANDLALRMARARTGRHDVIVLNWAYHGHLTSLIEISSYKYKRPGGDGKPGHVWEAALPDSYRAPPAWEPAARGVMYAASVREQVSAMSMHGRRPGAFIAESMPSVGGQIVFPDGYLAEVYRDVRGAGGVTIADEVQVGFGRIGTHMWAFEAQGVVPDILTLGKPIGNGHPLAALVTTAEIADAFANGMEYFNTFGGNAVSCVIGHKVLDILERDGLQANAKAIGDLLMTRMRALAERYPEIGDVRGSGLFLGLELVEDRVSKLPATERAGRIVEKARNLGILLGTDGPYGNVIKVRPAMIFSRSNADHLMSVLETSFAEA